MGHALHKHEHHTYGDYLAWPEETRYELIDGVAYLMAPAPSVSHQDIAGEVYAQLKNALRGQPCRVFISPLDVCLPKADEDDEQIDTVVQPDVLVVCDGRKISERGVRGAPDWVLEVISPSSASQDQVRKLRLYEFHGVREYWIIHPRDRILTVYRLGEGGYGRPHTQDLVGETPLGILPGVDIVWDDLGELLTRSES